MSVSSPSPKDSIDVATCLATSQERQRQSDQKREAFRQQVILMVRKATPIFAAFPTVRKAYLFGSVTRPGAMREDSDVDIAIEGHLTPEDYFALWRELERATPGRDVELIELDRNVHFAERVRQTGELIYERTGSNS